MRLDRTVMTGLALLAVLATYDGTFFIVLCDAIYHCGCRALWNGAAQHCNVHAPSPPHCPWCLHTWAGTVPFVTVVLSQGLMVLKTAQRSVTFRVVSGLALLPLVGGVTGVAIGWITGYWS